MNRKERRAEASRERRGDTMGKSYSFGLKLPDGMTQHPDFEKGQKAAEGGELPPGYYDDIKRAASFIRLWMREHPTAELRWLEWDAGRVFLAAALRDGAQYLADSPDAHALLSWLDRETGEILSLNMAGWALRLIGQIPMPPEARP